MARFTSAPVEEVAPKRRQRRPSLRAQVDQQYREALGDAVRERREALVVELEPEDKALTVRNRIKRAARAIGLEDIAIRRRGNRIVAYPAGSGDRDDA